MTSPELVVIGEAVKTFGIKGEIKIKPFTASLDAFNNSDVLIFNDTPFSIVGLRNHKGFPLIKLEGVETIEAAQELIGSLVKTSIENLPEKEEAEYYWFQLEGMRVLTVDGRDLGRISTILETGANDVLEVQGPFGEVLIPMIDQVVLEINTEKGEILVDPLEGLIPDG